VAADHWLTVGSKTVTAPARVNPVTMLEAVFDPSVARGDAHAAALRRR
jgi:hypothetical protein